MTDKELQSNCRVKMSRDLTLIATRHQRQEKSSLERLRCSRSLRPGFALADGVQRPCND